MPFDSVSINSHAFALDRDKMLLHNRDDFINFVVVSGSYCTFHGKSDHTFL